MIVNHWITRQNIIRAMAALFWIAVIIVYQWYSIIHDLSPLGMLQEFLHLMRQPLIGPVVYIIFYILQPLIFFPSWLLTVSSGYLYGVVWGSTFTIIASNLSAMVAYCVGRFFQQGLLDSLKPGSMLHNYAERLRSHSFETVLIMRFMFLPYDIVSYLAGFMRVDWRGFLVATVLGSIPGTLAFVSFGASMDGELMGEKLRPDPWLLATSFGLFAVSLLLWRVFKRYF